MVHKTLKIEQREPHKVWEELTCSISGTRHATHVQNPVKGFGNHKHNVFAVIWDTDIS